MTTRKRALASALPVALATLGVGVASCGLFVDDDPRSLFPDAGGAVVRLDAALDARRSGDARADAPDARRLDAGGDAVRRDAGAGPDASEAGSHDGAGRDARPRDAGADVPPAAAYCSTAVLDAAAAFTVLCQDFDEDGGTSFIAVNHLPSSITLESAVARSAPSALVASADPSDGGPTAAYLQRAIAPSPTSHYRVQFDLDVTRLVEPASGSTVITQISFGSSSTGTQSDVALAIRPASDAGASSIAVSEGVPGDGGQRRLSHAPVALSLTSGWMHVELDVSYAGSWGDVLKVDSVLLENHPLQSGFANTASPAIVNLGLTYVQGNGARTVYIDNLLIETE